MSMHDYPVIGWGIKIDQISWNVKKLVQDFDKDYAEKFEKRVKEEKIENNFAKQLSLYLKEFSDDYELFNFPNTIFVVETACESGNYLYLPADMPWKFSASDPIDEDEAIELLWKTILPYVAPCFTKKNLQEIVGDIYDTYYG